MKFKALIIAFCAIILLVSCTGDSNERADSASGPAADSAVTETGEPWTSKQLISPAVLVKALQDSGIHRPQVFSIGPSGLIKNAREIGPAQDQENLDKLKAEVSKLPKDAPVVIYCGCCPFTDCPNIRPSFKLLNEMGFTNHRLLNIPQNLKVNWIDEGYPMAE